MSKKVEDIDVRNRTYYFFNDISNIKKFDPNKRLGSGNGLPPGIFCFITV